MGGGGGGGSSRRAVIGTPSEQLLQILLLAFIQSRQLYKRQQA